MTSFTTPTRQARATERRAPIHEAAPARADGRWRGRPVAVSWAVSRAAAARAFPGAVAGDAGGEVTIEIAAAMDSADRWIVSARLIDAAGEEPAPILSLAAEPAAAAVWTHDPECGLEHLDVPGLLSVSMERGGRVVYARTSLLERFGLAGGRYEVLRGA